MRTATYVYEDFRVTFTPRADETYGVRAVDATGRATEGTFVVPLSKDDLERIVLRLAQNGTTRRATPAGVTRDVGDASRWPMPCGWAGRWRRPSSHATWATRIDAPWSAPRATAMARA